MRIGIDGACLANRRGFGRFARQMVQALARAGSPHQFVVLVDAPSSEQVEVPASFERVVVPVREAPSRAASAQGRRSLRDMLAVARSAARARLDILYFPATYSFVPAWDVGRIVVTMHDTLALAYPELVFPTRLGLWLWTIKEHVAARWSDRIVTVSEASRRDLEAWFGLDPARVRVIPEAPDPVFGPRPAGPESQRILARVGLENDARFLLYVGGLSPHKNLLRLLEAFGRLSPDSRDLHLVLVGDHGDVFHTHVPELRETIGRLGLGSRVHLPGFVEDPDLAHLYSRAVALVQPSLLEGFGLPPVEAMACGSPVLASRTGSLPEVIGDAGLFFDPLDITEMTGALDAVLTDGTLRERLAERAGIRAAGLTWDAAARALLAVFEEFPDPENRLT